MKYLDYRGMKEFYTIDEVCRQFEINKQELKHYADKYSIQPQEDQYGNWGFRKVLVRKLHNFIYKEQYNQPRTSSQPDSRKDPWHEERRNSDRQGSRCPAQDNTPAGSKDDRKRRTPCRESRPGVESAQSGDYGVF